MLGNGWEIEAVKQFWREYKRKIEATWDYYQLKEREFTEQNK